MEEDPHYWELKEKRPDAWKIVESTFREHWSVQFETGFRSPPYFVFQVDLETGEVTEFPVL